MPNVTHGTALLQVFFVAERTMPGWCVVLKKDSRGRRINSTESDNALGQEESSGDRSEDVFLGSL